MSDEERAALVAGFCESGALRCFAENPGAEWFRAENGAASPLLIDLSVRTLRGGLHVAVLKALANLLPSDTALLADTRTTDTTLAQDVALYRTIHLNQPMRGLHWFPNVSAHVLDHLEGSYTPGEDVVVVDTVCGSDYRDLSALLPIHLLGLKITGVLAIVDGQRGGAEVLKHAGIPLYYLFTQRELVQAAVDTRKWPKHVGEVINAYLDGEDAQVAELVAAELAALDQQRLEQR